MEKPIVGRHDPQISCHQELEKDKSESEQQKLCIKNLRTDGNDSTHFPHKNCDIYLYTTLD